MTGIKKVAVLGGGAAGFFAALSAKSHHPQAEVILFEKTTKVLAKVKVSGGGRCNVTNAISDISELCMAYPRGGKQLRNSFHRFDTADTINWFESRGVALKTESDGRVFPVSNDSQTIINCLLDEVQQLGVTIAYQSSVQSMIFQRDQWQINFSTDASPQLFDRVIVATGGSPKLSSFDWLEDLGHLIIRPVPSLFTFNMPEESITNLTGVVVENAKVRILWLGIETSGPLLITHWGMSGPAILKASSFGARELSKFDYQFDIQVNWVSERNTEIIYQELERCVTAYPQKMITNQKAFPLPNRLWVFLLDKCGIPDNKRWSELGKKKARQLAELLANDLYKVSGKTTFKDEFVTCGGVALSHINLKTMSSKSFTGLYFAGEVLDIDAITGGFNFQAAWTTAYIAGQLA